MNSYYYVNVYTTLDHDQNLTPWTYNNRWTV